MTRLLRRASALALAAVVLVIGLPSGASAAPADPRITAAVAAWKDQPVYVDPQYVKKYDDQLEALRARIARSSVPVYVAVMPTGAWFPEKGDTALLAGRLAAANGTPGLYLVMEDYITIGVHHLVEAYAPRSSVGDSKESPAQRLSNYLDEVKVGDQYDAEPARTEPRPPREERVYPPERFTVGTAIGTGIGGAAIGMLGGALLAGLVLGLAAAVARLRGGQL